MDKKFYAIIIFAAVLSMITISGKTTELQGKLSLVTSKKFYKINEPVSLTLLNSYKEPIYFNTTRILPYTTIYLEGYFNGTWKFIQEIYKIEKLKAYITSKDWLKQSLKLSNKKIRLKFLFPISVKILNSSSKFRIRLDYCFKPVGEFDWLKRSVITGSEKGNTFMKVYSNEFYFKK